MISPFVTCALAFAAQDRADLRVDLESENGFTEDQPGAVILTATNAGTVQLDDVELFVTVAREATGVGVAAACSTDDDGTAQVTTCFIGRMQPSSSITLRLPLVPNEAGVLDVAVRGATTTFGEDVDGNTVQKAFDVAPFVPQDSGDREEPAGCASAAPSTLLWVLALLFVRRSGHAAFLVCASLSCVFAAHAAEEQGEAKPMPMLKQDYVPPIFAAGPSIADRGFDAWLKAHDGPVKLPFTIWRKPQRRGAIGVHTTMSTAAPVLRFSDGALGVPLDERIRQHCGDADPCRLWLAGRIGESMPLPDPDPSTIFNVHAVHGPVEGEGPHHAEFIRGNDCLAIRLLKPMHCARGPSRCEKCKAAGEKPAAPKLLDVCPYGDAARPTVEVERAGKKTFRAYDVIKSFNDIDEARAFATKHGLTDVAL